MGLSLVCIKQGNKAGEEPLAQVLWVVTEGTGMGQSREEKARGDHISYTHHISLQLPERRL